MPAEDDDEFDRLETDVYDEDDEPFDEHVTSEADALLIAPLSDESTRQLIVNEEDD